MKRVLAAALMLATGGCGAGADETAGLPRGSYAAPALGGARISYLRGGTAGGRLVVFVHGTPGDAAGWAGFLARAPAGFDYVAIDRPGFGASGPDGAVTSLERQALALAPLLAGAPAPVILVGHSYGGPVIVAAAAHWPDRVAGLVILAGALDPGLEKIHPLQRAGEWPGVRDLLPRALRNANRELIALKPELERLAPRLQTIRAPVTIIHGTADAQVPVANVGFMRPRFAASRALRTIVLRDQTHFLPWQHQPLIEQAIAAIAAAT